MPEREGLRILRAANAAPLTLDGTRTYIVGRERVAIIDPGPDLPQHLDAVAETIGGGVVVSVLLTHDHPDHAAGAPGLASRLDAPLRSLADGSLRDGDTISTDAGELRVVATPGHTPDHVAFHWLEGDAVFVGDLMLGGMDSALIAPPEGDLAEYLASLERVRGLGASVLYPSHGVAFDDAGAAVERYIAHRHERLDAVRRALDSGGGDGEAGVSTDHILDQVYGPDLSPGLRAAAAGATRAYLEYLEREGEAQRLAGDRWRR